MKPYYPPMKKAILAIDSFKGCLTSAEAEAAACRRRTRRTAGM